MGARGTEAGPVTLRDVARAAGTTPMTVSNVVNGRSGQVSEAMARRVLDACDRLGYRPNAAARGLRTNRRMAIGVVIVDPSPYYVSDPLTAAMLAGLDARLGRSGYSTVLRGVPHADLASVSLLRAIETDAIALILSGGAAERALVLERVAATRQPLLFIQDEAPDDLADAASVLLDDRGGALELARHLSAPAPRDVVFLAPALAWSAMARREAGLREGFAAARVHVVTSPDEGFEATQAALRAHVATHGWPDVVVGGNDQMAIAGMKLAIASGQSVPGDIRFAGFNGLDFWRYATPDLTTVRAPAYALGEAAGDALLARLDGTAFLDRRRVLPVELRINASSEARSGPDVPA
jgi:LacI family transcriptional regulator